MDMDRWAVNFFFFCYLLGFENSKRGIGNRSRFLGFSFWDWDLGERWDGVGW